MEKMVGEITHVFDRIGVAIVYLEHDLKIDDNVHIVGKNADFVQTISSMQVDRQDIDSAKKGATIGIKVEGPASEGDKIFLV
jgi:putative protease